MAFATSWLDPRSWTRLPASLSPVSLNLQRRFVSYLLKRTLGPYLRADADRLDAQADLLAADALRSIAIADLDIDESAVNKRLGSSDWPVRLERATIGRLALKFSWPSASWTAAVWDPWGSIPHVRVEVSEAHLSFALAARSEAHDASAPDIVDSVLLATDDFVRDELSQATESQSEVDVEASTLSDTMDLPGTFRDQEVGPAGRPAIVESARVSRSLLSGLVARILATLEVELLACSAAVRYDASTFRLHAERVWTGPNSVGPSGGSVASVSRSFELCSPRIDLACEATSSPGSSSSSASLESSLESAQEMQLSQAVADLRLSRIGLSAPVLLSPRRADQEAAVDVLSVACGPEPIRATISAPSPALGQSSSPPDSLVLNLPPVRVQAALPHMAAAVDVLRAVQSLTATSSADAGDPVGASAFSEIAMTCSGVRLALVYDDCERDQITRFLSEAGPQPAASIQLACGALRVSSAHGGPSGPVQELAVSAVSVLERKLDGSTFVWMRLDPSQGLAGAQRDSPAVANVGDLLVRAHDRDVVVESASIILDVDLCDPSRFQKAAEAVGDLWRRLPEAGHHTRTDPAHVPKSRHLQCPAVKVTVSYMSPSGRRALSVTSTGLAAVSTPGGTKEVRVHEFAARIGAADHERTFFACGGHPASAGPAVRISFGPPQPRPRFAKQASARSGLVQVSRVLVDLTKADFDQMHYAADSIGRSSAVLLAGWSARQPSDGRSPPTPHKPQPAKLCVAEVEVRVHFGDVDRQPDLAIRVGDVSIHQIGVVDGTNETAMVLEARDLDVRAGRRQLLQAADAQPLTLKIKTTSSLGPLKQTRLSIELSGASVQLLPADVVLFERLASFARAPPGVFEDVPPNNLIRIKMTVIRAAAHLNSPGASVALRVPLFSLVARPSQGAQPTTVRLQGSASALVAEVDTHAESGEGPAEPQASANQHPTYTQIAAVSDLEAAIRVSTEIPWRARLSQGNFSFALCADTVNAVTSALSEFLPPSPVNQDDTPDRPDRPSHAQQGLAESRLMSARFTPYRGGFVEQLQGVPWPTYHHPGLLVREGFLLRATSSKSCTVKASTSTLDFGGIALSLKLHQGYDWSRTRTVIEQERRTMRKRLQKIRQLLADGQSAETVIQEASTTVFNSIHIGLPATRSDLTPAELMDAIDEELVSGSDEPDDSDASSWDALPTSGATRPPVRRSGAGGTPDLLRSASPALEVALSGVSGQVKHGGPATTTQGLSVLLEAHDLAVFDHIKTSTWRKFLTELRPSEGGIVRPTEAPMLKVFFSAIAPLSLPASQREIILKVRLAPIRLYVDQDAVAFLKTFGGFQPETSKASGETGEAAPRGKPARAFIRRFEIFPVRLKLDYKPKHVDLGALRKGKAVELMNFFHFEGSDMTLRHATFTGVDGAERLGDLLQDIWTPDVKANQLSDVISGIAPVRSAVNVGTGVADLVLLPIDQIRRDGRLTRGLQKGTLSFARSTALEAVKVGARLATGTQVILERAEVVLGAKVATDVRGETIAPGSMAGTPSGADAKDAFSRYAEQPANVSEGIKAGYQNFGESIRTTAQTILAVPLEVFNEGSGRAVLKAVPIALIHPVAGASGAIGKTLLGLRHTLDPHASTSDGDKYKQHQTLSPSSR